MKSWAAVIANGDTDLRTRIGESASALGYDIVAVSNAKQIASAASRYNGRLILAPLAMPGLRPKRLRHDLIKLRGYSYLIYSVDPYTPEQVASAFQAGADDVIGKDELTPALDARLHNAARFLALEEIRERFESEASLFDEISATVSFHSRRYFEAQLANELTRTARFAHSLSLILAHIDTNPWDERRMRVLGTFLAEQFRSRVDWIARYDEQKLACVLPETPLTGALCVTQRLDTALSKNSLRLMDLPPLSIHFGVSSLDAASLSSQDEPESRALLNAAETYLQEAIRTGREVVAGPVTHH